MLPHNLAKWHLMIPQSGFVRPGFSTLSSFLLPITMLKVHLPTLEEDGQDIYLRPSCQVAYRSLITSCIPLSH